MVNRIVFERIAKKLQGDYPDATPEMVEEQLKKEPHERNIVGLFASTLMVNAGVWRQESEKIVDA